MVPTMRANELSTPVKQILTDIAILLKPKKFDPVTVELTYTIVATDYALKAVVVPLMAELRRGTVISKSPCGPWTMSECISSYLGVKLIWL